MAELSQSGSQLTCRTCACPCAQVQALLTCLDDPSFNLQVCICSVGAYLYAKFTSKGLAAAAHANLNPCHYLLTYQSPVTCCKSCPQLHLTISQLQALAQTYSRVHFGPSAACAMCARRWCWQHAAQQLPHTRRHQLQPAHRPGRRTPRQQVIREGWRTQQLCSSVLQGCRRCSARHAQQAVQGQGGTATLAGSRVQPHHSSSSNDVSDGRKQHAAV